MAKSFIDVVQDSPRTRLGIPVKTKKNPSRNNTPPAEPPFGFELHGWLVPLKSRMTFPSSVRSELPSAVTRPLGRPTSRASQARNKAIPPPDDADSQVRPRRRTAGAGHDAIPTGPPRCYALDAHQAPSSSSQV